MPRQAHGAHHVDLEHFHPVGIFDLEEGFRFVESEIVDEDIDLGKLCHEGGAAFGIAEIECCSVQFGRRRRLPDPGNGVGDGGLVAPVDDDFRAHLRKPRGCSEPDAPRRAGDQRELSRQIGIHLFVPLNSHSAGCYFAGGAI
jgi:hypothetical protein